LLFVAIFRAAFGRFGPSDHCLMYFSVRHDLFGRLSRRSLEGNAPSQQLITQLRPWNSPVIAMT
jgi:hypothetical protein